MGEPDAKHEIETLLRRPDQSDRSATDTLFTMHSFSFYEIFTAIARLPEVPSDVPVGRRRVRLAAMIAIAAVLATLLVLGVARP